MFRLHSSEETARSPRPHCHSPWILAKSDGMGRPVSDGMRYPPKLSTCSEPQEIEETDDEEA